MSQLTNRGYSFEMRLQATHVTILASLLGATDLKGGILDFIIVSHKFFFVSANSSMRNPLSMPSATLG